jgi:hypothetical protein
MHMKSRSDLIFQICVPVLLACALCAQFVSAVPKAHGLCLCLCSVLCALCPVSKFVSPVLCACLCLPVSCLPSSVPVPSVQAQGSSGSAQAQGSVQAQGSRFSLPRSVSVSVLQSEPGPGSQALVCVFRFCVQSVSCLCLCSCVCVCVCVPVFRPVQAPGSRLRLSAQACSGSVLAPGSCSGSCLFCSCLLVLVSCLPLSLILFSFS